MHTLKVTYFLITVAALSLIVIGCSSTAGDEQGDIKLRSFEMQ